MLQPGTRIDRYVLGHPLGRGGMATVVAARHALLGTWHALKVLHRVDPGQQERLIREGRVQSRLDAALVIPVTDVIRVGDSPALVMPLVRGQGLDALLRGHSVTEDEALAITRAIVHSVAHAHESGVVHRDLKPSNVLVDAPGDHLRLRVADFGLVRSVREALGAQAGGELVAGARELEVLLPEGGARTRRGSMLGSPAYAAPEQLVDARRVDRRADVWSLGIVLYELLVGDRPFVGHDLKGLIASVCEDDWDRQPVPPAYRDLLARCLAKDPQARPDDAGVLLAELPEPQGDPLARWGPLGSRLVRPATPVLPDAGADEHSTGATLAPDTFDDAGSGGEPTATAAHGLPAERDAFVGREQELEALWERIQAGARLLSLAGPGGCGKTRLAVRFGWRTRARWAGGTWFCDLVETRSADDVCRAVARSLDAPVGAGDVVERLGDVLAERGRCLVILDNLEQVVGQAAPVIGRWLDRAPEAVFLATTRQALGVRGERVHSLPPLPADEAVRLFLTRAEAVRPGFAPDAATIGTIEELVALLDRLPLAIELAAARMRTLSPDRILSRMDDRFRLLSTQGRKHRQATLRTTLDWSWDLLDPSEHHTLAQLSVFEGGFDLLAAEQIVQVDGGDWVLDLVEGLVDKCLLRSLEHERFGMLVSVQAYAAEKLAESGHEPAVRDRHARWFARLGEPEALQALNRHGGIERREALCRDLDNVLAAAAGASDGRTLACLALAGWAVLMLTGPVATGRHLLERAHAHPDVPDDRRVELRRMIGVALEMQGQPREAREWTERALELARRIGDSRRQSEVLAFLGNLARTRGDLEQALSLSRAAHEVAVSAGAIDAENLSLGNIGVVLGELGRLDEADAAQLRSLELSRRTGYDRQAGIVLSNLGVVAGRRGHLDEARLRFQQSLEIAERLQARRSQVFLSINLGLAASMQGRHPEARARYEQAIGLARIIGERRQVAACLGHLGVACASEGDRTEARRHLERCLSLSRSIEDDFRAGLALGELARLDRRDGRLEDADQRLQAACTLHREGARRLMADWELELGRLRLEQGRLREAGEHLDRAAEEASGKAAKLVEIDVEKARLGLARGDVDQAWARLQPHRDTARTLGAALIDTALVEVHRARGEPAAAREALERARAATAWSLPGSEVGERIARLSVAGGAAG